MKHRREWIVLFWKCVRSPWSGKNLSKAVSEKNNIRRRTPLSRFTFRISRRSFELARYIDRSIARWCGAMVVCKGKRRMNSRYGAGVEKHGGERWSFAYRVLRFTMLRTLRTSLSWLERDCPSMAGTAWYFIAHRSGWWDCFGCSVGGVSTIRPYARRFFSCVHAAC